MRELPIIFQTEMVRAILENYKHQTRRTKGLEAINEYPDQWRYDGQNINDDHLFFNVAAAVVGEHIPDCITIVKCPYAVGDHLWVREAWSTMSDSATAKIFPIYRASWDGGEVVRAVEDRPPYSGQPKWKPSIHMPRKYSRVILEVLKVRVQRIQDISEEDAIAEGIVMRQEPRPEFGGALCTHYGLPEDDWQHTEGTAKERYSWLWDAINLRRSYSWASNPFVFAYDFKRVEA